MPYNLIEGLKRSLTRGIVVGLGTFVITAVSVFSGYLPTNYAFVAPILALIVSAVEKFLRNYQENKDPAPTA